MITHKAASLLRTLVVLVMAAGTASCGLPGFAPRGTPVPTPQCVEPSLTLGTLRYTVQPVKREADGFPKIPNKKDTAYWVEGTTANYVFGLSPTKDNLAPNLTLKPGDPIVINWADCTTDEYVLTGFETAAAGDTAIFDQSRGGVTVFVGVSASSSGPVIRGERPVPPTAEGPAEPTPAVRFDVSILDEVASPDPQSVKIALRIANKGDQPLTLTTQDVSLQVEGSPEVFPTAVEPALPQEIGAHGALNLVFTFPKPQAASAVLRILDTTFDYYFQN